MNILPHFVLLPSQKATASEQTTHWLDQAQVHQIIIMSRKITSHIISGRLFRCSSSIRNELLLRYFSSAPIESPPPHQPELEITKTRVLSSIAGDKHVEYARGWAWQHVLLSHRLHARRQVKQEYDQEENIVHEDDDCILLLEHAPVYTLGRGATEDHLTFLADSLGNAKILERLSRRNRGPDSARLSIDRRAVTEEILQLPIEEAVDMLSSRVKPVLAPNGVPIYRVDRGGEVTFHGPSQLVVYPLVDLKRPPYQSDLHWYLRMVEEVVIRILKHYDIESVRDSINTGMDG